MPDYMTDRGLKKAAFVLTATLFIGLCIKMTEYYMPVQTVSQVEDLMIQKVQSEQIQQQNQQLNKLALTFDDGPGPYTQKLLDELKERGVKATFFVVGENIAGYEDILLRMSQEGHLIGNHTYSHCQLSKLPQEDALEELNKTGDIIEQITGRRPEYVRPPYGEWSECLEMKAMLIPILWDVDPLDWKNQNTALIVDRVKNCTRDGDIILLHDIYPTSIDAAINLVDYYQNQGFIFVTADQILMD